MPSQEEILKTKAVMLMATAVRAKMTDEKGDLTPDGMDELNMWKDIFKPYPAVVVQGAVVGWLHDTRENYGRFPAPGAIVERIETILSMTRRRRFKAAQARRQTALAEHLGRRSEARRIYLSAMRKAAALPPAEAERARIAAGQEYADALVAIDRAISLAASDTAALEEARHG